MGRAAIMRQLARWHIWLGWLIGLPLLMWTVSGLVMVVRPIEEVRGEHLRAAPAPIASADLVLPRLSASVAEMELTNQPSGPVWIITEADGRRLRYSAHSGRSLPPLTSAEALRIAASAYAGEASYAGTAYFPADAAPLDLRRSVASWQITFADDTHVYVEDATGQVLAVRTSWWRLYDFAWGLHIMDLQTRENTSHPVLILFAALAGMGALIGCTLLFRRRKARTA